MEALLVVTWYLALKLWGGQLKLFLGKPLDDKLMNQTECNRQKPATRRWAREEAESKLLVRVH